MAGHIALITESSDPHEFICLFRQMKQHPDHERQLREAGRETALHYAWPTVIRRALLPRLDLGA